VFLPNYSSGNFKTNSIQPVSACLAFFETIWHFLQAVWHFLFTWTWKPWWSVRKGFNQSIRRTKEQKTRFQCLARAMPKPVMPAGDMKSAKLLRRNSQVSGMG